jgi:CxxC motif-containing protein
MLTTTVLVKNGKWPLVSVKSTKPVPKQKIFEVLKEIKKITLDAPVLSGQTILENVAGTKINIVSTKTITKIKK